MAPNDEARATARRIVDEVLANRAEQERADHVRATATPAEAATEPRGSSPSPQADGVASPLESAAQPATPSQRTARRIVEEVLAARSIDTAQQTSPTSAPGTQASSSPGVAHDGASSPSDAQVATSPGDRESPDAAARRIVAEVLAGNARATASRPAHEPRSQEAPDADPARPVMRVRVDDAQARAVVRQRSGSPRAPAAPAQTGAGPAGAAEAEVLLAGPAETEVSPAAPAETGAEPAGAIEAEDDGSALGDGPPPIPPDAVQPGEEGGPDAGQEPTPRADWGDDDPWADDLWKDDPWPPDTGVAAHDPTDEIPRRSVDGLLPGSADDPDAERATTEQPPDPVPTPLSAASIDEPMFEASVETRPRPSSVVARPRTPTSQGWLDDADPAHQDPDPDPSNAQQPPEYWNALPAAPTPPPRRTGRWLITTIVAAFALAVLFPLAIRAVLDLVSLS